MLTVYTYKVPVPAGYINFSNLLLSELVDSALAVYSHQKDAKVWFGYLDPWMLTPQEDVLLRKVIRAFPCGLVTHFPLALSQSWKNEVDIIYTADVNGNSDSHHNGCSVHNGSSSGHNTSSSESPSHGEHHQDRKAGRTEARRVKKGQSKA